MTAFPDPLPGIIPFGSICTLAGATGVGKTALFATWVERWLTGRSICGVPTNTPTAIGIIAGDRRWRSHRQWFDVAGCPELPHYSLRDDDSFNWHTLRNPIQTRDAFQRALDKLALPPGGLVGVDPLAIFLPGRVNDYKDVAVGLGALDQLLRPRDLTAIGIFHQSKQLTDRNQQYKRPQDRILGSAAQLGFSDTAMYLLGPEDLDTPYYGFGWVPHHAPPATFKFIRDTWGLFVPYKDQADRNELEEVCALVPGPETPGAATATIAHAAELKLNLSRFAVHRYLRRLEHEGRVEQPARGRWRRTKPS